jgi:hypothetical protein
LTSFYSHTRLDEREGKHENSPGFVWCPIAKIGVQQVRFEQKSGVSIDPIDSDERLDVKDGKDICRTGICVLCDRGFECSVC